MAFQSDFGCLTVSFNRETLLKIFDCAASFAVRGLNHCYLAKPSARKYRLHPSHSGKGVSRLDNVWQIMMARLAARRKISRP
jgi:hypothetical protein